jgi:type VI secretion system secreted protein VgrG
MPDSPPLLTIETAVKDQKDPSAPPPLMLAMVQGTEGISMPYTYEVTMFRDRNQADIDPQMLIGTPCSIGINLRTQDDPQGPQYMIRKGVFEHFEHVAGTKNSRGLRVYYGRVVPAFKLLTRETRYRIFENEDVTSIIEKSLGEVSHLRLNTRLLRMETFPKLDYCVQFGETTFGSVSRLMARYGMWYYFDHDQDPQDRKQSAVYTVSGNSNEASFFAGRTFIITADRTTDTDARTTRIFGDQHPKYLITYVAFMAAEGSFGRTIWSTIGGFFAILTKDVVGSSDAPDVTVSITNGMLNNYLQNMQQVAWSNAFKPGSENAVPFFPSAIAGGVASLAGILPNIIKAVKELATQLGSSYGNSFLAVPWKPDDFALPIPVTAPRPTAYGPHLAVVVGPTGTQPKDGESDIWADALGRVRVRFPWDPSPAAMSANGPWKTDTNTCWVRVSEGWAGAGFGTQFLPRIGQQVLVEFIDGDPERPIVVGRVYSAKSGWTALPFPSPATATTQLSMDDWLQPKPSDQFQRSGIRTRSTPVARNAKAGFHLLRLDDEHGKEQFLLRSQGRMDVTALGSHFETTCGDRHTVVGGKDPKSGRTAGDSITHVGGECDLRVDGSRYEHADKDYQLSVKEDTRVSMEGSVAATVGSTASLSAGGIVLSAAEKITLKVGGSFVVLTPDGVYISGPMVYQNSGGVPGPASPVVLVDLQDAKRADSGES